MASAVNLLLWIMLLVAAIAAFVVIGLLLVRRRLLRLLRPREGPRERCRCGYDLRGIQVPRCPECGRVIGFDKTFAELGVSESEVRNHIESRHSQEAL
jgi:hypothetical protein